MARIKIKTDKDPRLRNTKLELLNVPADVDVCSNGVYESRDGLVMNTSTDEVDKILEPATTSRRTIICYRIEEIAYDNSLNNMADEIDHVHVPERHREEKHSQNRV